MSFYLLSPYARDIGQTLVTRQFKWGADVTSARVGESIYSLTASG
jgi:hypothetical protein